MSKNASPTESRTDHDHDHLVRCREPASQGGRRYWICSNCERPPGAFGRDDVRHDADCPHR
jgi:hypothetical protein